MTTLPEFMSETGSFVNKLEGDLGSLVGRAGPLIQGAEPILADVAGIAASVASKNVPGAVMAGVQAVTDVSAAVKEVKSGSVTTSTAAVATAVTSQVASAVPVDVVGIVAKLVAAGLVALIEHEFPNMPADSKARLEALTTGMVQAIAKAL